MSNELRLHGHITPDVEYYATAAGRHSPQQHFFHMLDNDLRLFAPGNEILLSADGIRQSGTGGSFCTYMFGVEQPLSDLSKADVVNRLMLLGAGYDANGQLSISVHGSATQNYEDIFLKGHAIDNYFFFIEGLEGYTHSERQEELLRHLGKPLKRMANLCYMDDSQLAEALLSLLPPQCTVFLVRLSHVKNRHFQKEFQSLYYRDRNLSEQKLATLQELATNLGLDPYQQERIRIDVMYRHRDNYRIIDDYKKILIESFRQGSIDKQTHARLTRLKTLALRNEIPEALLTTLDDKLQTQSKPATFEPEYTAITRSIFQDLLQQKNFGNRDMIQLLFAKQHARKNYDHSFEQLLLEMGQLFDEQIRDGAPLALLEEFSYIITFFDRYDNTATSISRIAFMEHFNPAREQLLSLLESRTEFNKLVKGLFQKLFFDDILGSRYLGRYGKKKIDLLQRGMDEIAAGLSNVDHLEAELRVIDAEERLYLSVLQAAKEQIRTRYSRYESAAEQEDFLQELNSEMQRRDQISRPIDSSMFQTVIHDIKKEALYLRTLLPQIIADNDVDLRNDFLTNSGLDHFYIEELEREYFELNKLNSEQLKQLRSRAI